jgi:predicted flap endonuclease-1-like 5' DNA nuclease/chromosome segregation ATPase
MWFLLIQIFFLLALAALLGAALAWWWMRRKFVDVTESHAELTRQVDAFLAQGKALTRDDIVSALNFSLASYRPPQPDLQPIQNKLASLEYNLAAPDAEIQAMNERVAGLEQSVSAISAAIASMRNVHLEAIDQHLRGVSARIDNLRMPDIESVNSRVASLALQVAESRPLIETRLERIEQLVSGIELPDADLGPVHSGLAALQVAVENLELPEPNLAPLVARLNGFAQHIEDLTLSAQTREEALGAVIQRASALEQAVRDIRFPEPDLAPVTERLALLEQRLASGPSAEILVGTLAGIESDLDVLSRKGIDLEPIYTQMAAIDASLSSIRTELRSQGRMESLERRLSALQESILNLPQPDYTRIDLALRSIESRFDLGALEDRLTAIEYGLTAVHHSLRSRPDLDSRPRADIPEARPAPRPLRPAQAEPAPRPQRKLEAILSARRDGDEANLLTHAAFGRGDDLEEIVGVGPMLAELLHDIGVYYFWQIAEWTKEDVAYVDGKLLHFRGRIERDNWVGQARELAALPTSARRPGED